MDTSTFAIMSDAYHSVLAGALDHAGEVAKPLAYSASILSLFFFIFGMMFYRASVIGNGFKWLIAAAAYSWIIVIARPIADGLLLGAVDLGLNAAGSSMSPQSFLTGTGVWNQAMVKYAALASMANDACKLSPWGCVGNLGQYTELAFTGFFVWFAIISVGILCIVAGLIFKIAIIAGILLLPCILIPPLASFGYGAIRAAVHCATQLFVLGIIVGVGVLAIGKIEIVTDQLGIDAGLPMLTASLLFLCLILASMAITAILTSGALAAGGSFIAGPGGMALAMLRSGAGHLDPIATKALSGAGNRAWGAMQAAANRISAAPAKK